MFSALYWAQIAAVKMFVFGCIDKCNHFFNNYNIMKMKCNTGNYLAVTVHLARIKASSILTFFHVI